MIIKPSPSVMLKLVGGEEGFGDQVIVGAGNPRAIQLSEMESPTSNSLDSLPLGEVMVGRAGIRQKKGGRGKLVKYTSILTHSW